MRAPQRCGCVLQVARTANTRPLSKLGYETSWIQDANGRRDRSLGCALSGSLRICAWGTTPHPGAGVLRRWPVACLASQDMANVHPRQPRDADATLLDKLAGLEQELQSLRRQLQEPLHAASQLPDTDFLALRCSLADGEYGMPISRVKEILRYVALTPIADAPLGVVGAVNVRGDVIPVLDTRVRLGLPATIPSLRTSIVLAEVAEHKFGMLFDAVVDVVLVPRAVLSAPHSELTRNLAISNVASIGTRVLQLLDLARLLTRAQWDSLPRDNELPNATAADSNEP
jgi:purine-binding chemotaxis protein CheW